MSAVGEAGQHLAPARGGAGALRWCELALRALLGAVLVTAGLTVVGAAVLAWRLSQGPLEIAWLANRIARWALPIDSPARLTIGQAYLMWDGFEGGDRGLLVRVGDVDLLDTAGALVVRVDSADVTLSLPRLLALQVAPRVMLADGVRLRAVRSRGAIGLALTGLTAASDDGGTDLDAVLAELRQPAKTDRGLVTPGIASLAQLRRVRVRNAEVSLFDAESGRTVRLGSGAIDLRRGAGGGVQGVAQGRVALGGATASLTMTAGLLAEGGTHLEAKLEPLPTASVAQEAGPSALALLGVLDGAVAAEATLDLSAQFRPLVATWSASTGPATLSLQGGTLRFDRLAVQGRAGWPGRGWEPDRVELVEARAVVPSPRGGPASTLGASGAARVREGKVEARLDLTLDHAAFADLKPLWPVAWSGHLRPWLAENVTGGTVRDGSFHLSLAAPSAALGEAQIVDAGGTMEGDDVTIHWLRPVAPIEHARAHLQLVNADVLDITVPSAVQGGIALRDGLLHFTGLAGRDQFLSISSEVQGRVPELLALLREKALNLLDKHPLPISRSAGTMAGTLTVQLPMKDRLDFDQVLIQAKGRLQRLLLGGLVAGRALEDGDVTFDVNQNEMSAGGTARVAGIPGTIGVGMDFRAGPPSQVLQRANFAGRVRAAQLDALGLDTHGVITSGVLGVEAGFEQRRSGAGEVSARADLAGAGLSVLGWRKLPGQPASASATLLLEHDAVAGVRGIRASGPGLDVVAGMEVTPAGTTEIVLERAVIGPTQASGQVWLPGPADDTLRVRLAGSVLDLAGQSWPAAGTGDVRPVDADLRFGRVILPQGHVLSDVSVRAEWDGRQMRRLQASTGGSERLRAVVEPDATGRRVSARLEDVGALLHAVGSLDALHGGSLALEAHYDDRRAGAPLSGTLDLSDFGVRDAVVVGKLLQAVTVYGIVDALRREGVYFKRLQMPFTYERDLLLIGESRAFSSSLGLTAQGWIDFGRQRMDLRGTVVPAYAINAALGRIPLVGKLFSPEWGGGLVAVNYGLTGRLAEPSVHVNPLSALTPGFLRRVFSIFP